MEAVFLKLLNMSIAASWLILAVILLRIVFKKAPKWVMGILWTFVAVRLICPVSFESILSLVPSAETVPQNITSMQSPSIYSGFSVLNSTINPVLSNSFAPSAENSITPMQIITIAAAVIWAVGIAAMLVYAFASFIRIRRKVSEAVLMSGNMWICDRVSSPFIFGILRPRIYLPSSIDEMDMQYVLMHEKAHMKRRDYLWKPLGYLLLSVYWFNPAVWAAYILFCRDIELACDEKVIEKMGEDIKKSYSSALINCSVSRKAITACPVAFGEVGVKERVKSVLNYKKPAFWIIIAAVVACAVTAVCLLTNPKTKTANLPSWIYVMTDKVYDDRGFSSSTDHDPDWSKVIEIDKHNDVMLWSGEELISGGLFKEIKLTKDNFDGLFFNSEAWYNDLSPSKLRKETHNAWYMPWDSSENGVFMYMILKQNDDSLYLVYANVENGLPVSIRYVYALEDYYLNYNQKNNPSFDATVVEVADNSIRVEPDENSEESKIAERIAIMFGNNEVPNVAPGDKVKIVYDGEITEASATAILENIYAVHIYDKNGNIEESVSYPTDYIFYSYLDSPDMIEPSITFSPSDETFVFSWSPLSSYIAAGKYELTDDTLTLKTYDGEDVYIFDVLDDGSFSFNEKKSSKIPEYNYAADEQPQTPIPDGAIFSKSGYNNVGVNDDDIDRIIADIDGDGKNEMCALSYGPTSGIFTFELTVTENGNAEYFNIYTSDLYFLSFVRNEKGDVKVKGITSVDNEIHLFDISVKDGNVVLSENGEDIPYWGEQGINSMFR